MDAKKVKMCIGDTCLFCCSKCPVCESTNITVRFSPVYEYDNDIKNRIRVTQADSFIQVECNECGESFGQDLGFVERDSRLDKLERAISDAFDLFFGGHIESITRDDGSHENHVWTLVRQK